MNSQTQTSLKLAIRKLIHSSQVKPEAVEEIVKAVENEQVTDEYWENLFNNEGADIGIKQKIYSPQMVRLMTIRAMVLPETLPQLLAWLNIQPGKKVDENQMMSLELQSKITGYLKEQIKEKIIQGIDLLMIKLLKKQITPEILASFFQMEGSIWNVCYQDYVKIINYGLNVTPKSEMLNSLMDNLSDISNNLSNNLTYYYLDNLSDISNNLSNNLTYYYPMAKLFELLAEYKLAAYFYQVSCGEVPQNILSKMSLDPQTYKDRDSGIIIYGLYITRKATKIELMSMQMIDFMSYIKRGIIDWAGKIFNVLKFVILGIIAITITIGKLIFQVLLFLFYASICLAFFGFALQNFGVFFILVVIYLIAAGSNNN
ncbi:hypothetical protein [Sphaerospermopsis sp. FACHB-1194]|uniref:hypothetical protein n=1 Tax=Sphaerospermopsis sp. FACHB-1194 TaxID=2692862 RepID=UPI0016817B78|nr:hypothetical protein [Sphaerospermopsis sp. FACHB-1194]MBD2145707.1 hypothetical protein [Sphaerospermopsis sp. FACHB-1194]